MIRLPRSRAVLRRALAAIALGGFAIGSVLFWNAGEFDPVQFAINAVVASVGFVWLHFRWRAQERRALTPGKVKDIFS
ncbi:MAG: hypothetical protein AAGH57_15490 [Pseudomonadota bacterium]